MATTEERLAALEAKMAQLTATTPTTYYTHQYSGEEIDDAVGKIRSGAGEGAVRYDQAQTLTPAQQSQAQANIGTTWPCNPNLLDNWYFGNPVNQRGQTEYTRDGYTVDRWALVSRGAGSFLLHGSDNYYADVKGTFYQRSENERFIVGAKYTLSVLRGMITSPTLYHNTFDLTASNGWKSRFDVNGGTFGFYYGQKTSDIQFDLDDTKTLIAAKLELGQTQTLAHQENGVWVLNEVPDYGEQLRRCQRYCRPIPHRLDACEVNGTYYACTLESFEEMRSVPVSLTNLIGKNVVGITGNNVATIKNVYTWNKYGGVIIQLSQNPNMDIVFLDSMNYLISADL